MDLPTVPLPNFPEDGLLVQNMCCWCAWFPKPDCLAKIQSRSRIASPFFECRLPRQPPQHSQCCEKTTNESTLLVVECPCNLTGPSWQFYRTQVLGWWENVLTISRACRWKKRYANNFTSSFIYAVMRGFWLAFIGLANLSYPSLLPLSFRWSNTSSILAVRFVNCCLFPRLFIDLWRCGQIADECGDCRQYRGPHWVQSGGATLLQLHGSGPQRSCLATSPNGKACLLLCPVTLFLHNYRFLRLPRGGCASAYWLWPHGER